jgi:phage-related protein (TIGR01555 family)
MAIQSARKLDSESASRVDGWMNVLTGLGICGRDKKQSGSFILNKIFTPAELDMMYRSDGILRLIVDLFADEMVRQGWEIEGDVEGKATNKMEELNLACVCNDLCKYSRLYGGAIAVIGIADGLPLDQPVDESAIRDVQWLRVFDRYQAFSRDGTFEADLNSPNYGYPNVYQVTDNRTGAIFFVHYSRILRMDWNILPPRLQNFNAGWGDPLAQTIYEQLRNYSTAFSSTATIFQDFVNSILYIPNLSALMASQCGDQPVMKRLDVLNMTKSIMNTLVLDENEKYDKVTTNVTGIAELLDRFMVDLSAVSRVPVSLLFGRSAAGLNATGDNDVRNFYDAVKQQQEVKLKPCLEKITRYIMLAKDGPFNGVEPDQWSIQFVPLWQNTEEQDAITRRTVAETDAIYMDRGVLDANEVAASRFGGNKWSMNTELDLEARNQMNSVANEFEDVLEQKEEEVPPGTTQGPDFESTGLGARIGSRS